MGWRILIPREDLEDATEPLIRQVLDESVTPIWWGPNSHVVLYGVRGDTMLNLVLLCVCHEKHCKGTEADEASADLPMTFRTRSQGVPAIWRK